MTNAATNTIKNTPARHLFNGGWAIGSFEFFIKDSIRAKKSKPYIDDMLLALQGYRVAFDMTVTPEEVQTMKRFQKLITIDANNLDDRHPIIIALRAMVGGSPKRADEIRQAADGIMLTYDTDWDETGVIDESVMRIVNSYKDLEGRVHKIYDLFIKGRDTRRTKIWERVVEMYPEFTEKELEPWRGPQV